MPSSSDIGVVPVRDGGGNVVSYTVRNRSGPEAVDSNERSGAGWVPSSRSFETGSVPEPTPLVALKAYTRARVKARRRLAEEDGVILGGVVYDTSDDAHLRLMTLMVFATRDPDYTASILIRDGTVRQMNALEIYNVAVAIANHMQACALWEIAQLQAIEDATTTDELITIEAGVDDGAPTGDTTEPSAPEGTQPPPAFHSATFTRIQCETIEVSSDASVTGTLDVAGTVATQSTLQVGSDASIAGTLTSVGAVDLNDTLRVQGIATVEGELTIQSPATLLSSLSVGADASFAGSATVTGSTFLSSTLSVSGNSTLAGLLQVAGSVSFEDALVVAQATTLKGALTAESATSLLSDLSVGGSAVVQGSLSVTDPTSLASSLQVGGQADVGGDFTIAGSSVLGGTLDVAGDTNITGALVVEAISAFRSGLSVTGDVDMGAALSVEGAATMASSVDIQGATSIQSTLLVEGECTLNGALSVASASTFASDVAVSANLAVTGSIDVTDDAVVERLYARDSLAVGSMYVDRSVSARTKSWVVAGSFLWRRGDRQPTAATVAVSLSTTRAKAAVAFYEQGRNQVLGYGVAANAGDTLLSVSLGDTLFTANDSTVFLVGVYLSNATEIGRVSLANFLVSTE